ncbi:MAG: metallopeptidase TldD-related protein, partial [Chloroflexota bacterium]|nr:metallopeptidase TldD-related protein [Chloroflexota bacterium]
KAAAEEAEVYISSHRETSLRFEANRLKQMTTREGREVALRLIKGGRIGFAVAHGPLGDEDLLRMALEIAPFGAEAKFHMPGPIPYPQVEVFDPAVESLREEKMAELGQTLIDRVRREWPEALCEAWVFKGTSRTEVSNSAGGQSSYDKSVVGFGVEGVLIRGTDMLFVGDNESSCESTLDIEPVVRSTLRQLELARETVPPPSGTLPVLFTPLGVASTFILPLWVAFNGKTVLQGASPLGHRLGEVVFHPSLSLRDDATAKLRPGARCCDEEGVPSQPIPLIQEGRVMNFLYDLQTAGLTGKKSTGSASRAMGGIPSPSISVLLFSHGRASDEELIAEMEEGLVVEHLMGAGQGNVLGGDFSGNVLLGYKVEKGKIVGRIKDTMVSGNIYDALKEIELGREAKWVGGSYFLPPILCRHLSVAKKA